MRVSATTLYYGGWVGAQSEGVIQKLSTSSVKTVNNNEVQKISTKCKRTATPPPINMYFIVKPCASAQKTWITVGQWVRRGGNNITVYLLLPGPPNQHAPLSCGNPSMTCPRPQKVCLLRHCPHSSRSEVRQQDLSTRPLGLHLLE